MGVYVCVCVCVWLPVCVIYIDIHTNIDNKAIVECYHTVPKKRGKMK